MHEQFTVGECLVGHHLMTGLPLVLLMVWSLFWRQVHKRRARAWREIAEGKPTALRPGYAVVAGRVEVPDGEWAISVEIEQVGSEWKGRGGAVHTDWNEVSRRTEARPFYVLQKTGERVRVEPDQKVLLVDKLDAIRKEPLGRRVRLARLEPDEEVFVVGHLEPGIDPMAAGGYREGGTAMILRPPRDHRMLVATEPLDARARRSAGFHGGATVFFGVELAIAYLVMSPFDLRFLLGTAKTCSDMGLTLTSFTALLTLLLYALFRGRPREWELGKVKDSSYGAIDDERHYYRHRVGKD